MATFEVPAPNGGYYKTPVYDWGGMVVVGRYAEILETTESRQRKELVQKIADKLGQLMVERSLAADADN